MSTPDTPAGSSSAGMKDPDPWVNLVAEREALVQHLEDVAEALGDIPQETLRPVCDRIDEIDLEIATSKPASDRGLKAALAVYLTELLDMEPEQKVVASLLRAALDHVETARLASPYLSDPDTPGLQLVPGRSSPTKH